MKGKITNPAVAIYEPWRAKEEKMKSAFEQNEKEIKSFLKHIDNGLVRRILASAKKEIKLGSWNTNFCDYCDLQTNLILNGEGLFIRFRECTGRSKNINGLCKTLSNSGYNRESLRAKFFTDLKRIIKDKVADVCCDVIRKILK